MKKTLLSLAAVALTAAAAPALAQPWGHGGYDRYDRHDRYGGHYGGRLTTGYVDGLEWKINNAAYEGRISRGEARQLMTEFRQVQPLAWRVETGQASGWEHRRLSEAVNRIEAAVNRYPRYGRGYGHDRRW